MGDILILRSRDIFSYGIRPVAVVHSYEVKESRFEKAGKYDLTIFRDEGGSFSQWTLRNEVPKGVERVISEHETRFKLFVENEFKKVRVYSVKEALAFYGSREV